MIKDEKNTSSNNRRVAHTRTGTPMPHTQRLIQRLRPLGNQPALHLSWETLTHGT